MSRDVLDELAGLALTIALLLIGIRCIQLRMRWTTAPMAAVNDDVNRSRASGDSVAGDCPEGTVGDLQLAPPQGAGVLNRTEDQNVTFRGCAIVKGAQREPFAEISFIRKVSRSAGQKIVQLIMDQVDFGVNKCCTRNCSATNQSCDKNCKTVFIHKMTIRVSPKSWARDCSRRQLQPHHTAEVFGLQETSTLSFQMSFVRPGQASVTYQTGNTVSRFAPTFGWSPACVDVASNSVSWTWEVYRDANGRKLEVNKRKWGPRPPLGIRPSHMHVHPGCEASWNLEPSAELQQHRLEWDVTGTLHTAIIQGKRRLPGYSVTKGPILTFEKLLTFSNCVKRD